MGWIIGRWIVITVGAVVAGVGLRALGGGARIVVGLLGLSVMGVGMEGGCSPTYLKVGDDHVWTIQGSLGLPLATVAPETPRSLTTEVSQTTVHRDATRRISAHTGRDAVDSVVLDGRWVTVHVGEQAWSLPELTLEDLGYDPFTSLGYLHSYGRIPEHTVVGGQVAFPKAPHLPILDELKPGDPVQAHDRGQWWPAQVLALDPVKGVQVRYDGYGPEWDAWLWPHRLKRAAPPR